MFGKSLPVCAFTASLKRTTNSFRSATSSSLSKRTPLFFLTSSMIASNGSISSLLVGFIPNTTSPYICTKRRYESHAKRSFPVLRANPATTSSFKPKLRIVSIIPGIEARAPERTETNKGFSTSPNFDFINSSTPLIDFSTSSFNNSTTASFPFSKYSLQTSVVIVKPGGTGTPIKFISARFAPLPPNRFLMSAFPSA